MKDGIIKNDGTSRLVRSVNNFKTKYPTYDDFAAALVVGTLSLDILFNPEGWSQQPDFLNKANLLTDSTAELFSGLSENPVLDDVFQILSKAALVGEDGNFSLPNGSGILTPYVETGSYVGTNTFGVNNPNSLSFSKPPNFVWIYGAMEISSGKYNSPDSVSNTGGNGSAFSITIMDNLSTSYKQENGFGWYYYGSVYPFAKKSSDGKTLTWYEYDQFSSFNPKEQFNSNLYRYYYAAFSFNS